MRWRNLSPQLNALASEIIDVLMCRQWLHDTYVIKATVCANEFNQQVKDGKCKTVSSENGYGAVAFRRVLVDGVSENKFQQL